jgi:sarcosine oxidase subunit alpha
VTPDKPAFLGRAALDLLSQQVTRRLVGFTTHSAPGDILESHLVIRDGAIAGRITSVGHSHALGHTIGLVMVSTALAAPGTRVNVRGSGGRIIEITIADVPFYDPENARQRLGQAAART